MMTQDPDRPPPPVRPSLSAVGAKLAGNSGIRVLMEDLGQALTTRADMLMLGGGNPAAVPEVQTLWRRRMRELLDGGSGFDRMLDRKSVV